MNPGATVSSRRTWHLVKAATTLVPVIAGLAAAAVALGASNYSVHATVPGAVKAARTFKIKLKGFSKNASSLDVFLDNRNCAVTDNKELIQAAKDYMPGDSYFSMKNDLGPYRRPPRLVTGSFKETATAHAGTIRTSQRVCAYLHPDTGYIPTRARSSARYQVK